MVFIFGVRDESPEEEAGHDHAVVEREPVRVPQREPLGPADAQHPEGEAQLVNHLHLGNLLLPVAEIVGQTIEC